MKEDNRLRVRFGNRLVGTMALTADKKVAFAYDDGWLQDGFPISPFSLPLKKTGLSSAKRLFSGAVRCICGQPAGCVGKSFAEQAFAEERHGSGAC